MNKSFPKEDYKQICLGLQPSRESVKEVITMTKPRRYSRLKRKAFIGAAACITFICSLSVGVVAATDGQIVEDIANYITICYKNLTIDQEASTPWETVAYAEDGTEIHVVRDYGENGKYYVTLVQHEDSHTLGLLIGEEEFDITDPLLKEGVYTREYTYEGKAYQLTVTGSPEHAELKTEQK